MKMGLSQILALVFLVGLVLVVYGMFFQASHSNLSTYAGLSIVICGTLISLASTRDD